MPLIILHSCCAPCFSYVHEFLETQYTGYEIIPFFYNPNIAPFSQYRKRAEELENFCSLKNLEFNAGEYDARHWTSIVKDYRSCGERSERCWHCYEFRLAKTFEFAFNKKADLVASTLSISPHKNAQKINEIGKKFGLKSGISFLEADFKKNDGFKKSIELSKIYGFYRQNYCGCIYSKMEKEKRI